MMSFNLLKAFFNPILLVDSFFILRGGGSGGGGHTTSTATTTNLPEYARPYFQELLKQTGKNVFTTDDKGFVTGVRGESELPQQTRVGMQDLTRQGISEIGGMQTPGQFGQSTAGLSAGQGMGFGAAQQGLGRAFDYNPQNVNAQNIRGPQLSNFQLGGPQNVAAMGVGTQNFGQDAANFYMNPFQQNVTDIALREARQQGDLQKQAGAMGAIGRGTFGGARQALMQAEGDRNLMRTMGDIQAQGSQQAFQNAQQQFQADQARQLQAQQANQSAGMQAQLANQQAGLTTGQTNLQALLGVQQLGSGQSLEAQKANQAAGLQAAQLNQQGQQFSAGLGKDIGLAGLSAGLDSSKALGALGTEQQNAELARIQAKVTAGEKQQAQLQGESDTDYQNRMASLNYEKQQLEFYSNILRGNAGALGSTQVQYAPPPNAVSQIGGLGLAGLGLSKALG